MVLQYRNTCLVCRRFPIHSEIRTDKLKKTATTAATAITSGVASLFGSGKLKELERANEKLQDEVSKRNTNIEKL